MAVKYQRGPYDIVNDEKSLTETEHLDSCDINIMLKSIKRGQQVRGGGSTEYGYDDTTMDAVQFRIQKADLEEKLLNGQKEFTQEQLDLFPENIKKQFGYKLKKEAQTPESKNDDLNDENDEAHVPQNKAKKPKTKTEPKDSE